MLKLKISSNDVLNEERALTAERTIIGRRAECHVQLLDPTVSGQHALIALLLDEATIEDLGSTNGTYVNGQLVKRCVLRDGDIVEIGQHVLRCQMAYTEEYDNESAEDHREASQSNKMFSADLDDLDERQRVALHEFEQTVRRASPMPVRAPDTANAPQAWLRIRSGPNAGKRVALDRNHFSLGASRQRLAVVARQATGYYLVPTNRPDSFDGDYPLVNGERADPAGCPLYHRDLLDVGGVQMEFIFDDNN